MNETLKDIMGKHTPKINTKITDGTAKYVLSTIPAYLDEFFKTGIKSLSKNIDLRYLGYRRITPKEEFSNMLLKRAGTVSYDLSHNDVYIIDFRFEYNGVLISRHVYLPYASRGNLLVMGGANYHITPVLSDTVITPSPNGVFVRLLKAKLNFNARTTYFVVDGVKTPGKIIHGEILKPKQITDMIGRPMTSTSLYLLGKYGLVETLSRYGGVDDVIVTNSDDVVSREGYIVYQSTQIKPRGLKAIPYIPHNVKILVSGVNINRPFVDNLIYGLIYTLDILPDIESDLIHLVVTGDVRTEISFWRLVLGKVIYKNSYSIQRISQDLEDHFDTLEGYVDPLIKTKLAEAGLIVNDFFDLVALIITRYNNWVISSKEYNSNIENRYLDILYYLTYDVIIGFNRAILSLNKRLTKTKEISYKEVLKILSNELSSRLVYGLTKSTEPNLAVASVDAASDLIYPKVSSVLVDQSQGNGVKRNKKTVMPDSAVTLKGGDLGFGSLLFMSKNLPSPRFKMNIFMDYDVTSGKVKYPLDIKRSLEKLNELLQGLSNNTKLAASELSAGAIKPNDL